MPPGRANEYGEHHDPETHLIPKVLEAASGESPHISVFGGDYDTPDGTCVRDYIHIADLGDAHIRALDYLDNGGRPTQINLGNGVGFSVLEVIEAARKVTGQDIAIKMEPRRPGDPSHLIADAAKAHDILGWKPEYATASNR